MRILFVCLGNICRSTAAQAIFQHLVDERGLHNAIEVDSAGTYGGHAGQLADARMIRHATRRGYELTHRARRVEPSDFDRFDKIIAMDYNNAHDLRRLAPSREAAMKICEMINFIDNYPAYDEVPDPYYGGASGFELVLDMLEEGCHNLLTQVSSELTE